MPDTKTDRKTPAQTGSPAGVKPRGRTSLAALAFSVLVILVISAIALVGVLLAMQFLNQEHHQSATLPGTLALPGDNTAASDGAPVSILPVEPEGITILRKQPEPAAGLPAVSAPVAAGAGIATGFAMDVGAADSFLELTRRFATIVSANGSSNFGRLEPRAILRETVSGLEARLLIGPFDSEEAARDACSVLTLEPGLECTAARFEGELIARE